MIAFASAESIGGQFHLTVPIGTNWRAVERGIAAYLLRRADMVTPPTRQQCNEPMAETLESDIPPTVRDDDIRGSVQDWFDLENVADQSLDPARMDDETRAAIVAGELGRQFQPVTEGRRYYIHRNRTIKFVWLDRRKLLAAWQRGNAETRAAIKLLLEMVRECRLSRGERKIAAAECRMADSEPPAFIAPPRHATPLCTGIVMDDSGIPCPRFDAVFAAELPLIRQVNRHPLRQMTEAEVERAIESLDSLRRAAAERQARADQSPQYQTWRPSYWLGRMYADLWDC